MSLFAETLDAIRSAMKLTDDVRRAGDDLQQLSQELREHDRRITRLEAQWETAALLSRKRLD